MRTRICPVEARTPRLCTLIFYSISMTQSAFSAPALDDIQHKLLAMESTASEPSVSSPMVPRELAVSHQFSDWNRWGTRNVWSSLLTGQGGQTVSEPLGSSPMVPRELVFSQQFSDWSCWGARKGTLYCYHQSIHLNRVKAANYSGTYFTTVESQFNQGQAYTLTSEGWLSESFQKSAYKHRVLFCWSCQRGCSYRNKSAEIEYRIQFSKSSESGITLQCKFDKRRIVQLDI